MNETDPDQWSRDQDPIGPLPDQFTGDSFAPKWYISKGVYTRNIVAEECADKNCSFSADVSTYNRATDGRLLDYVRCQSGTSKRQSQQPAHSDFNVNVCQNIPVCIRQPVAAIVQRRFIYNGIM
jgi:hypothetical protein